LFSFSEYQVRQFLTVTCRQVDKDQISIGFFAIDKHAQSSGGHATYQILHIDIS